jgi:FKBP-type peptidyl-prolyl cis-trans isomerase 2
VKIGARKKINVQPDEGYGNVDPKALQEILKEKIPRKAQKVGAMLMPDERTIPMHRT